MHFGWYNFECGKSSFGFNEQFSSHNLYQQFLYFIKESYLIWPPIQIRSVKIRSQSAAELNNSSVLYFYYVRLEVQPDQTTYKQRQALNGYGSSC
jgi:hypothetical protein